MVAHPNFFPCMVKITILHKPLRGYICYALNNQLIKARLCNSPLIEVFLPRKKVAEGTSLISYVISHVTEEAGVDHTKENFENDTNFELLLILVMVFCLPFVGPKGIDFTPQSSRLFRRSIFILRLDP